MAEAKAAAGDIKIASEAKGKRGGKLGFYTVAALIIFASPFIFPTIMLLLIGLAPTIIELFTDDDNERSSTAAVGAMNFAGTVPFILDLWGRGQKMGDVFVILQQPAAWLFMLGGAAIGKLIVYAIPQAMASLTIARYESRLKILKHNQEQLKTVWGPDVATVKPLDKIVRLD